VQTELPCNGCGPVAGLVNPGIWADLVSVSPDPALMAPFEVPKAMVHKFVLYCMALAIRPNWCNAGFSLLAGARRHCIASP